MTQTNREAKLDVPGASLHYQIAGSGPLLLLIHGAPADAAMFGGVAAQLAEKYTVVTYDHRGYGLSSLTGEPEAQVVPVQADDAHRILAEVTSEPVHVVAVSGGALIALELVAKHPEQVASLFAFEPSAIEVLPTAADQRAKFQGVVDTYNAMGVWPAMGQFIEAVGGTPPPPPAGEPTPEMLTMMEGVARSFSFFFGHQLLSFNEYVPDIAAVKASGVPVTWSVGADSAGTPCNVAGRTLAAEYGAGSVVEIAGEHDAATSHTAEFVAGVEKTIPTA